MHQDAEECSRQWGRRADDHLGNFKSLLEKHTAEEMERYQEIIERLGSTEETVTSIDERLDHIEDGQKAMNQSIHAFMETHGQFFTAIQRAFPKDEDGKPDYDGHKKAHLSWISNAKDEKEVMEFVRKQMDDDKKWSDDKRFYVRAVVSAVLCGLVIWAGKVLWYDAVKNAPQRFQQEQQK